MAKVVLVTGGRGFAASHLIERLRTEGDEVVSVVRDNTPDVPETRVTEVFGDIRDHQFILRALVDYSVTHVAHLAAQAIVPKALQNPYETWDSNVRGTYSVLEACRRYSRLEGILVASSDKALGSQDKLPYLESDQPRGIYPYDASKVATEIVSRSYQKTYDLPIAISRCANLYGPGDTNRSRIIPDTILSTLDGQPVQIRSDGTPERDYLYIKDAVYGLAILMDRAEEFKGEVFHFGTETPVRVIDLVERILRLMSSTKLRPVILGQAKAEIDTQYMSAQKAKHRLHWAPITPLDEGLQKTIAWWRQRAGQYRGVYDYEMGYRG